MKNKENTISDNDLKQLAIDIAEGIVFTSDNVKDNNYLDMVFMPLLFLNNAQRKELAEKKPAFFYEYIDKASPRSVNGMPCFTSFRYLPSSDLKRLNEFYARYTKSIKEWKKENE